MNLSDKTRMEQPYLYFEIYVSYHSDDFALSEHELYISCQAYGFPPI